MLAVGSATDVCEGRRDAADTSRLVLEQNLAGQLEVRGDGTPRFTCVVALPSRRPDAASTDFSMRRRQQH